MFWAIVLAVLCWRISRFNVESGAVDVNPENADVLQGANHTLKCRFTEPVNCDWHRGNIQTIIGTRYSYSTNNGTNTTDCSIIISSFNQMNDAAVWQCFGSTTYLHVLIKSKQARLYAIATPTVLLDGITIVNLSVLADGIKSGSLTCMSEDMSPANRLSWNVNGSPVTMGNMSSVCNNGYCDYTLMWSDDWKPLVNAANLSCVTKYGATTVNIETSLLKKEPTSTTVTHFNIIMTNTALIIAGAVIFLIIASFCLLACSCAKKGSYQPSDDKIRFNLTEPHSSSNLSLVGSVVNFNSCSKCPLQETSLADAGYCGSEKLENEIIIKPEFGNTHSGAIVISYSNSMKVKRDPIDSMYVNRCSAQPQKSQSLGCRTVRPRMPLPFGMSVPSVAATGRAISGPYSVVRDNIPKPNPHESRHDLHTYYDTPLHMRCSGCIDCSGTSTKCSS